MKGAFIILALLPALAGADIYKCTGADGKVNLSFTTAGDAPKNLVFLTSFNIFN